MNWLDWTIAAFLAASVLAGFKEGFIRIGIGMVALLAGFLTASWFYGVAAEPLVPLLHSRMFANFAGFFLILLGVMLLGTLLAAILVRMFHLVGLSMVDRALGGVLGGARAVFLLVVVTMVVMAFAPRRLPAAVDSSRLAPYVFRAARVMSAATPYELKEGFHQTLARIEHVLKKPGTIIPKH